MIISIKELIDLLRKEYSAIPIDELMSDFHLRYVENGFSLPINDVDIDIWNKSIELRFNEDKILEGME